MCVCKLHLMQLGTELKQQIMTQDEQKKRREITNTRICTYIQKANNYLGKPRMSFRDKLI